MKKLVSVFILLMLLVSAAAMAEEEIPAISPDGAGITLHINIEWYEIAMDNTIYFESNQSSDDPVGYSFLLLSYGSDSLNAPWTDFYPMFAIVNRLATVEYTPENYESLKPQVLGEENGRVYEFYLYPAPDAATGMAQSDIDNVNAILASISASAANDIHFSEPIAAPSVATMPEFKAQNLVTGETVDNSVFQNADITMVNIWATYCSPCISEMPDLYTLSQNYADKNVQIIGIVFDAGTTDNLNADTADSARQIVNETGANYLHIIPDSALYTTFDQSLQAVPTTFFIDREGNIIDSPYIGSNTLENWSAILNALLAE